MTIDKIKPAIIRIAKVKKNIQDEHPCYLSAVYDPTMVMIDLTKPIPDYHTDLEILAYSYEDLYDKAFTLARLAKLGYGGPNLKHSIKDVENIVGDLGVEP